MSNICSQEFVDAFEVVFRMVRKHPTVVYDSKSNLFRFRGEFYAAEFFNADFNNAFSLLGDTISSFAFDREQLDDIYDIVKSKEAQYSMEIVNRLPVFKGSRPPTAAEVAKGLPEGMVDGKFYVEAASRATFGAELQKLTVKLEPHELDFTVKNPQIAILVESELISETLTYASLTAAMKDLREEINHTLCYGEFYMSYEQEFDSIQSALNIRKSKTSLDTQAADLIFILETASLVNLKIKSTKKNPAEPWFFIDLFRRKTHMTFRYGIDTNHIRYTYQGIFDLKEE